MDWQAKMHGQSVAHRFTLWAWGSFAPPRWRARSEEIEEAHLDRLALCIQKRCHDVWDVEYWLVLSGD